MTEAEWLAGADPTPMQSALPSMSQRQLRLFGCACFRRVRVSLRDERSLFTVEIAERAADGAFSREWLDAHSGLFAPLDPPQE